jgi:sugar O-acyltransferase (sialic acid O-acetyltransferase NeuD family)
MAKNIIIIGAGPSARDILDIFEANNEFHKEEIFKILGFVVESEFFIENKIINGYPLLGDFEYLKNLKEDFEVIVAFGKSELRRQVVMKVNEIGCKFTNIIHPSVIITKNYEMGIGNAISAGTIISNNVKIGNHIQINLAATIGHDDRIDDFVTISPGAHISGNVHIEEGAFLGVGANTVEKINIGKWSVLAAGSTLFNNLESNKTALGVPAKIILSKDEGWHLK